MPRLGLAAVSAAAVLWAAGATVASHLFDRGASPLQLTAARAWVGALGVGAIVLARRSARAAPARTNKLAIIPFGLSIAAANYFYYSAIDRLPVAIAIVIQYTAPGLVVLWASFAQRRRPSRLVVGALGLAFLGVALLAELPLAVARGGLRLDGLGVGFAVGSAIAFAVYVLTGERLGPALGADRTMARGFAVAGAFWLAVLVTQGRPDTLLEPSFLPGIAFVTVGATIAPFLLFLWGLGRVGAPRAGIISTLEPVAAAVLAFAFLGQGLSGWQLAGGVLVVVGIGVVQAERPQAPEVLAGSAAVE